MNISTLTENRATIPIPIPQKPYDVQIIPGGLDSLGQALKQQPFHNSHRPEQPQQPAPIVPLNQKVLVVSNPLVFGLYGQRVITSLTEAGYDVCHCVLPAGEQYKTLASIEKIYDVAYINRLERNSAMIALGGGVIGDMTGFAAATWLRGIRVIQIPTTLLSMVDASMGGKTGVNYPKGKNLIGAFHQPSLVLIDPYVLKSLPGREFRAGIAEIIKYGVIWDRFLFDTLEATQPLTAPSSAPDDLLHVLLERSCRAKADVVSQDVRESGIRAILNYGHTIGHAIESLTNYTTMNHGEAIAIGMAAAGQIAVKLGLWEKVDAERQNRLIEKTGLPIHLPDDLSIDEILVSIQGDKKVRDGNVRFILPKQIGDVLLVEQISHTVVRNVLQHMATLNGL